MTHSVDRGDVVWADVAVVDGGGGLGDPVGVFLVGMGSDLLQQPELNWTTLVIPPEEQRQEVL